MADPVAQLVALGFSDYEARAYVTLLKLGEATGYQVAKESGIPRSMIYQVLDKLIARGAVLTQSFGDLVRYAPDPPELLLERMQDDLAERVADLTASLQEVAVRPYGEGPSQTWSIAGAENILARAREITEHARERVCVSVGDDDVLDRLVLWLGRARSRGVETTVVAPGAYEAEGLTILTCPGGSRFRQAVGHGLALTADGAVALIGEVDRSATAIWTTNAFAVAWLEWCIIHGLAEQAAGQALPPAEDDAAHEA